MLELLDVEHPAGNPVYTYESGAVPPETVTAMVVKVPTVTLLGVAVKELMTGPDAFTTRVALAVAVLPPASVTVTLMVDVPVAVGVQLKDCTLPAEHPPGSPV